MAEALQEQEIPQGAYEWFTGLVAIAFLIMGGSILAYGFYGSQMTAGLDSACAEAAFNSGKKLEGLGNFEQAIQRYRQAMEGRFETTEQQLMCGRSIGDLLYRQSRYAEAIEAYRSLPVEAFAKAGAYPGYVNSLRMELKDDEALRLGREWLAKAEAENDRQQLLWAHHALMRIADGAQDDEQLTEHAQFLVDHDPASDAHLVLAKLLSAQGKKEEALGLLGMFLKNTDDQNMRGTALKLQRDIESAQ